MERCEELPVDHTGTENIKLKEGDQVIAGEGKDKVELVWFDQGPRLSMKSPCYAGWEERHGLLSFDPTWHHRLRLGVLRCRFGEGRVMGL